MIHYRGWFFVFGIVLMLLGIAAVVPPRLVFGEAIDCVKPSSVIFTVDRDPPRRFLSRRFASCGLVRQRENKLQIHP